jgi:hypothetical protein
MTDQTPHRIFARGDCTAVVAFGLFGILDAQHAAQTLGTPGTIQIHLPRHGRDCARTSRLNDARRAPMKDELITLLQEQRTKVPMTAPVDEMGRGRAVRARRRILRLAAALTAAAAVAVAVAVLAPSRHQPHRQPRAGPGRRGL